MITSLLLGILSLLLRIPAVAEAVAAAAIPHSDFTPAAIPHSDFTPAAIPHSELTPAAILK